MKHTFSYSIKEVSKRPAIDKDYIKTNGRSKNLSESLIVYVYCDFQADVPRYWYLFELANNDSENFFKVRVSKFVNIESKDKHLEWNLDLSGIKQIIKS